MNCTAFGSLEATQKNGFQMEQARRVFYVDEDSWIFDGDIFNKRDELIYGQHAFIKNYYEAPACVFEFDVMHDMTNGITISIISSWNYGPADLDYDLELTMISVLPPYAQDWSIFGAGRFDRDAVKGFLDPLEGAALYAAAAEMAGEGLCVEIGSYCGKSTIILGTACQKAGGCCWQSTIIAARKKTSPAKNISTLIWTMVKAACLRCCSFAPICAPPDWKIAVVPVLTRLSQLVRVCQWLRWHLCLSMVVIPCLPLADWRLGRALCKGFAGHS